MRYDVDLRIGDAEREAALCQLREHYVAGRLTLDELLDRTDQTLAAKTQSQLSRLMADLPHLPQPAAPTPRSEDSADTGRYLVLLLLLFALAAWLLMMAYLAARQYPPFPFSRG